MWESVRILPFGRLSIRNMCMFAAAMFVATFLYVLVGSPTAHAADITWNGDSIMYGGNEYEKVGVAQTGDSHGLPAGSTIYRFIETTSSPGTPTSKAHLIYFAPTVADPTTATSASYAVYTYTPPNTYSNQTGQSVLTAAVQDATSAGTTSCAVEGIGWIVCPVSKFLASAMDHLFDILAELLEVRPISTDQNNAIYRIWSVMRNFANVSFVIAFLIIIYSQLTSIGLSNYDLKKMLPKLIIAAVLVNISYWICAVAIDISNIAGWSIQEVFINMRNSLVGDEGNGFQVVSFESITSAILAGGTAAAAAGMGAYAALVSAGTVTGALYMLLPILVGVIIAALVALLIMAARQAIIIILVVISPLAFVAYLLPNTEKYYEKWQNLGSTMLLLFPIFSVVFGGSQLAGMTIIQGADSIIILILGMGVQVAPIVITPLLARFSGSLVSRIAGIVNNPGKGLIDRTRKFADERRDQTKARAFASPLNRRRDMFARASRSLDHRRRTREGWQKANENTADANWANTEAYSRIQRRSMSGDLIKNVGEARVQSAFENEKRTNAALQDLDLDARASKLNLDLSKAQVEANWEEIMAGNSTGVIVPAGLTPPQAAAYVSSRVDPVRAAKIESGIEASRTRSAKHVQDHNFAHDLESDVSMQIRAGGIDANGAQRALAHALKEKHEQRGEAVKNATSIIDEANLDVTDVIKVALNQPVAGIVHSMDIQEAAIKSIASSGNVKGINQILDNLDLTASGDLNHRLALVDSLKANGARPKYITNSKLNEITQGVAVPNIAGIDLAIKKAIEDAKFSPEVLVSQDEAALARMSEAITRLGTAGFAPGSLDNLRDKINDLKGDTRLNVRLGEREAPIDDILSKI